MYRRAAPILALLVLSAGCATTQLSLQQSGSADPVPASDDKSQTKLADIQPPVTLPTPRATTQPDAPAPIESLALYGSARAALAANQPLAAVSYLQDAIAIDPDSFDLYRALGEARLAAVRQPNQPELDAFEKALEIRPGDLRLQTLVGAQYATLGKTDPAMLHLREAMLTDEYKHDEVAAAGVDLLLARLLEQQGYDEAALDEYMAVANRLKDPSYAIRSDPELGALVESPESLWLEIGLLHEKHGQWADALAVYQDLAANEPSDFELQAKVVRMTAALGRTKDAVDLAVTLLMKLGGNSDSLDLLKDLCQRRKLDESAILRDALSQHPGDRALTVALAGNLIDQSKTAEARTLLESALQSQSGSTDNAADFRLAARLFDLYLKSDDVAAATRLIVSYFAHHPDSMEEIDPWWDQLVRASRSDSLELAALQKLPVEPSASAAKLFFVWRLAAQWRRDSLAHDALVQASRLSPPFAPAYRQLVLEDYSHEDLTPAQKQKDCEDLAAAAQKAGDEPLAFEVRGLAALAEKQPSDAADSFEDAIAAGGSSPQLLFMYSAALRAENQNAKAEELLWKLVGQRPRFDEAWGSLFQLYLAQQQPDQARKVLAQWLEANPDSVQARIYEADVTEQEGDAPGAEVLLLKTFTDHDDDPDVISALVALDRRTGHLDQFTARLDELRQREPRNAAAVEWLVQIYASQGRTPDATRVLDQARSAAAKDPDLLYRIAHMYELVNQSQTTEEVLQQVVKLDPNHASACNDLGYSWADQGKNLDRAESLIRIAVAQEPDNQSFLDSLGWVLYKRGQYDQALTELQRAVGPAPQPDPVVLDHLGDVLYRLGRTDDATRQWERSLSGLGDPSQGGDPAFRQQLEQKLLQRRRNQPVTVAPTGDAK